MLEAVKTIGSVVGLLTGMFVVFDRFVRHRPRVYWQPTKDDTEELGLVVYNTASEAIVIDAVKFNPASSRVIFRDDWRDVLDPDCEGGIAIIAPNSHKVFQWVSQPDDWDRQKPNDPVRATIWWSFTSSRWYWLPPVRLKTTVGRIEQIRKAMPPAPM